MAREPQERDPLEAHLDLLSLDAARAGEAPDEDRAHLERCAACRQALAEITDLSSALRRIHHPPFDVPADREARILWNARKQAVRARKDRSGLRVPDVAARWAAAAVAVLAIASFLDGARSTQAPLAPRQALSTPALSADVNGDGRIDILDAFALARAVDAHRASAHWDLNRDRVVDRADVDLVAASAVRLRGA